jgi:hypothetical protein
LSKVNSIFRSARGDSAPARESVFIPRKFAHAWRSASGEPGKIINLYQPAGKMEEFFRKVGTFGAPPIHKTLSIGDLRLLFDAHGTDLAGPPPGWVVAQLGRAQSGAPNKIAFWGRGG